MITQERKAELTAAGYKIENMESVWGADYAGQYRWINTKQDDEDGFGVIQFSVDEAWADASQYQEQVDARQD